MIVVHPVGATMGDFMTKPEGMDLGNIEASMLLVAVFAVVAVVLRVRRRAEGSVA